MKILWITEFFPASDQGEITGGVEARCFFTKRYLEKLGHQVKVVAEFTTGQRWTGLDVSSLPKQLFFLFKVSLKALRELPVDYDVIEATNFGTYYLAWIIGTLKRKPIVFWYPDVFIGSWVRNVGLAGLVGELTERIVLRLPVSRYIAISQTTKDKLIKVGVPAAKIDIAYCGVDSTEINLVARQKKEIVYDVCTVSRLVGYKKVEDLIRAVVIVKDKLPNIRVAIVGQGPKEDGLTRLAKSLGVSLNIKFIGYLPTHAEVLSVMAKSKIFCFPSAAEGFGIAIIEAASLGVPYVARDIPAIAEVTRHGQGGVLFKNNLAQAIRSLLTNKPLYSRKVKEAKQIANNYSWEETASQTEKIYEDLLSH